METSSSTEQGVNTAADLELYRNIESYDWENDSVYKRALERMSTTTQLEPNELELRAKCFYWARKYKIDVDFPKYKSWKLSQNSEAPTIPSQTTDSQANSHTANPSQPTSIIDHHPIPLENAQDKPEAPYPQNFADVADMIASGRSHLLPGIKEIPPTVLADKITPPVKERRRKPWERDHAESQIGGMFGDRRDILIQQE